METPFDTILDRFQLMVYRQPQIVQIDELFIVVYNFTKIARVLYLNMVDASEKLGLLTDALIREVEDRTIQCRLGYFQFIDQINRTGRVLEKKGFLMPFYARIYFFRNKIVEHWDDYLQFIVGGGNSLLLSKGKIAIPYALPYNVKGDAARKTVQQQIASEFAKSGVVLPSLEGKWRGEYADIIFASLEQIDSKLRTYNKMRNIGIPESLVTLLFKYGFPTPISDMEDFCKRLAIWLANLPV